jgi:hypothetical protein
MQIREELNNPMPNPLSDLTDAVSASNPQWVADIIAENSTTTEDFTTALHLAAANQQIIGMPDHHKGGSAFSNTLIIRALIAAGANVTEASNDLDEDTKRFLLRIQHAGKSQKSL